MFNQIKKVSAFFLATSLISASLVSCKKEKTEDTGNASASVTAKIKQDSELSYINSALGIAGLADTLSKSDAKFTFFAPVNAALDSLEIVINKTSADFTAEDINETVRYHIVQGAYRSADIPAGAKNLKVPTINNPADSLFITKASNGSIYVNGVKVDDAKKDITVGNGVIHKLVNNKSSREYGFLYFPFSLTVYDLIKASTGGQNGLDSLAKMIDRAATVDPTLIPSLKSNIVSVAAPINSELAKFVTAFGGDINKIPPAVIASVIKNHITPSREFLINLAIATSSPEAGTPTLGGKKLGYTIATFSSLGGAQLPALYILKEKPVPILASDFMCKNGVIQVIYGVILDK